MVFTPSGNTQPVLIEPNYALRAKIMIIRPAKRFLLDVFTGTSWTDCHLERFVDDCERVLIEHQNFITVETYDEMAQRFNELLTTQQFRYENRN